MVSRKKVLVIEDERPIAEPLADALRREGFDVHLAATAADGLEAFSARAPGRLEVRRQEAPVWFER